MVNIHDKIKGDQSSKIPEEVISFEDASGDKARRTEDGWEVKRVVGDRLGWMRIGVPVSTWVEWPIRVTGVRTLEPERKTISLPKVPDGMDLIGRTGTRYVRRPNSDLGSNWWVYGDDEARIHLSKMLVDDAPLEVVPALPPSPTLADDIANVRSDLPPGGSTRDAFDRIINQLNAFRDN